MTRVVGLATGSMGSAFTAASGATVIPVLLRTRDVIDPVEAQVAVDVSDAFFILSCLALSVFLALVAMSAVANRTRPAWLGWPAFVAAASLFVTAIAFVSRGWVYLLYGVFPIWVVITSVALLRGGHAVGDASGSGRATAST